ncbi:MAG TPA: hypothetical protein P5120_14675 [Spirochaetota bacterium]|nr:hypothetical protein [Spirochaetota bacterium]HRX48763.1 hypothetical protein [Spirochaetota bacterium]
MKHDLLIIEQITERILARLQRGFKPDSETLHFLKTSYGVNTEKELTGFLNDTGLNDGTIYELIVYPDDYLRAAIEKIISPDGLSPSEIETISINTGTAAPSISIITETFVHTVDPDNYLYCINNFIKKLNLDLNLQYLGSLADATDNELYFGARALLRKKRFLPSGDRGDFMKKIIQHKEVMPSESGDTLMLIDRGASLLSGNKVKALDELAAKKFYFESVLTQDEEYSALLKTWGMEMLLMKRVQPSPISTEDAIDSIRTIDRLTYIVYGFIIPPSDISVQVSIDSSNPPYGLFN